MWPVQVIAFGPITGVVASGILYGIPTNHGLVIGNRLKKAATWVRKPEQAPPTSHTFTRLPCCSMRMRGIVPDSAHCKSEGDPSNGCDGLVFEF